MAERTPGTHWRVSPLRSNPIIGLDLRGSTLFKTVLRGFDRVQIRNSNAFNKLGWFSSPQAFTFIAGRVSADGTAR